MPRPFAPLLFTLALTGSALAQEGLVTARIEPYHSVRLQSRVDGQVQEVFVGMGDRVEAGRKLLKLAAPELVLELRQAEAAVVAAETQLAMAALDQEIVQRERSIAKRIHKVAGEALPAVRERLELTERQLAHVGELYKAGRSGSDAVSQAQVEHSRAREAWTAAGEQVKAAEDRVGVADLHAEKADLRQRAAEAQIEIRRAELDLAKTRFEHSEPRSPFDGRIRRVLVSPGTPVRKQHTELLEIIDASKVRLRFELPEPWTRTVKVGTEVQLSKGDERIRTKVTALSGVLDENTNTMTGEIVLDNADGAWLPGSFVQLTVPVE